jgi:two-component system, LytTR family, response regulator
MIKAVILEDIQNEIDTLKTFLSIECKDVEIVGTATSLREGRDLIAWKKPDLAFLDIKFEAEDRDVFSMLDAMSKQEGIDFKMIFVTAYGNSDYKKKAIDLSDLPFINKPYTSDELKTAVNKAMHKIDPEFTKKKFEALTENLKNLLTDVLIPIELLNDFGPEMVFIRDIVKIEVKLGKYTNIVLKNGQNLVSNKNLSFYERKLEGLCFFRIHDNTLFNEIFLKKLENDNKILAINNTIHACSARGYVKLKKKVSLFPTNFPNYEQNKFWEKIGRFFQGGE